MLSFLNPRQQQFIDASSYNTSPPSSNNSTFSTFIKRGHLLIRRKSTSISSIVSTTYSSSSENSVSTEQKYQSQRCYYEGQPRRRITFSRVVIVNDPATFLIVKEDHTNSNSLGRKPSKQKIEQWLRRSTHHTML